MNPPPCPNRHFGSQGAPGPEPLLRRRALHPPGEEVQPSSWLGACRPLCGPPQAGTPPHGFPKGPGGTSPSSGRVKLLAGPSGSGPVLATEWFLAALFVYSRFQLFCPFDRMFSDGLIFLYSSSRLFFGPLHRMVSDRFICVFQIWILFSLLPNYVLSVTYMISALNCVLNNV